MKLHDGLLLLPCFLVVSSACKYGHELAACQLPGGVGNREVEVQWRTEAEARRAQESAKQQQQREREREVLDEQATTSADQVREGAGHHQCRSYPW